MRGLAKAILWGVLALNPAAGAAEQMVSGEAKAIQGKSAAAAIDSENDAIGRLYQVGDYAEATERAIAVLKHAETALGPEHPATLDSVNNLAALYNAQGRYVEAELLYRRALTGLEHTLGAEHPSTLISADNLGLLYKLQGRYAEAEPLLRRALAGFERVLGSDHPDTLTSANNLALLYNAQGRDAEAAPLYGRVLAVRERILGLAHPDTLTSANNLAGLYDSQGRYAEAEPLYTRALTGFERLLGREHPLTLETVNNRAALYVSQGRYGEAESLYRRALAARERVLGATHPATLVSAGNLAALYEKQGRYREAEPLYLRVLETRMQTLGAEHPDTLVSVNNLGLLYNAQGRYAEAEPLYRAALAGFERVLGPEHPTTLISVNNLGLLYASQGRYAEAEPLYRRALAVNERVLGGEHPDTLHSISNLAVLDQSQGRYAEAEPLLRRAFAVSERVLGPEHPDTLLYLKNLAFASLRHPGQQTLALADKLIRISRRARALQGKDEDERGARQAARRTGDAGLIYSRASWSSSPRGHLDRSFEALQLISETSTGRALARSAALASLDPAGQALVLERESTVQRIAAIDRAFATAAGAQNASETLNALETERSALGQQLDSIDVKLKASYPRYFELVQPQPLSLSAIRKGYPGRRTPLLKPDEALILLTPGDSRMPVGQRRGFAFAVTREGAAWTELPLEPETLGSLVGELRAGSAITDPTAPQPPVPRTKAKILYDALFGAPAIARLIASKPSWIISPQGVLLGLPFSALVTRDPNGPDDDMDALRATPWLGAERALSILPEIHMLYALRGLNRPTGEAGSPFFGVADPAFEGRGIDCGARSAGSYFKGSTGVPEQLLKLCRLPSTRHEVMALAKAIGGQPEELLLGSEATEAALRARARQLGEARVIHFATHALVSGEMTGLTQPALALMPPEDTATVDEANDGLLTAAEVAGLRVTADWVILSACNTAAGSEPGAEGLSGLARSFFYAGGGSLLVSQWPVRDDSGAMLVSETVEAIAARPGLSRAAALREAMRKVIASEDVGGASLAHPQDWAPFMFVGVDR